MFSNPRASPVPTRKEKQMITLEQLARKSIPKFLKEK